MKLLIMSIVPAIVIIGCGVMNSDSGTTQTEFSKKILKIDTRSLLATDINHIFIDSIATMNSDQLTSYIKLDTSNSEKEFLEKLGTNSKMLTNNDSLTVDDWIQNIKHESIDYSVNNLLFVSIFQSTNCTLSHKTLESDNNITIIIQKDKKQCNHVPTYHIFLYKVNNNIKRVSIKAFDMTKIDIKE